MRYGELISTIETPTYPIFVYANAAGGRTYVSGEVGYVLWDTALGDRQLLDVVFAMEALYNIPRVAQLAAGKGLKISTSAGSNPATGTNNERTI